MGKTINDYIATYQSELEKGDIQVAYERLLEYMMALKARFSKEMSGRHSFGNVSPGYMDYTYFPFFNDFLRRKNLRYIPYDDAELKQLIAKHGANDDWQRVEIKLLEIKKHTIV